jgi:hypothetical protein
MGFIMDYRKERTIEKRNVLSIVKAGLAKGWLVSVNDGEEWTLKSSSDFKAIKSALFTTDEETIRFRDREGKTVGIVSFVYGNDADEVVSDYGASEDNFASFEAFLQPITAQF